MKKMRKATLLCLALLTLASCSILESKRQEIKQGNIIDNSQLQRVTKGMTKAQVRYTLGDPVLNNVINPDRWEYVYSLKRPYHQLNVKHFIVTFKDDLVVNIDENYIVMN